MKTPKRSGLGFICLTMLIAIAMITIAGCVGSVQESQSPGTSASNVPAEHTTAITTVATRPANVPATKTTTMPASSSVPSNGVITFDPISDKKAGDTFRITGTTSLPAGTNLFWQVRPDTGTPPTGIDMNSRMGIMANNQVTKGSGTANQVSLSVDAKDTKDLAAGKYVVLAVSLKGDPMTTDPATGILAGYIYITLK
ncbi:MAG: hypothetical protein Q7T80_00095 [Methanoregula sp.]|nr:hypothetical protein [Methanoregula sp.]